MIERLQVILFVFLSPSFVEPLLSLSPLVFLGFESPEDERNSDGWILLQAFDDVNGLIAIDALNGLSVSYLTRAA